MAFDPYHKWLGIPPKDQPPNHYRLLGVELLEADLDVIENAADQRMRHVRSFQTGQHSADSQRILNEIAQAKLLLLDPDEKAAYDKQFAETEYQVEGSAPVEPAAPTFNATTIQGGPRRRSQPKNPVVEIIKIAAGGIAGTLIALLLLSFLREDWDMLGIARAVRGEPSIEPGESPLDPPPVVVPPVPEVTPPVVPAPDPAPVDSPPVDGDKTNKKKKKGNIKPPPTDPPPVTIKFASVDLPAVKERPAARGAPSFNYVLWNRGQPDKQLGPVADCFMVTSTIAGHWLGNGEWYDLNIIPVQGAAHWRLQGSGARDVAAGVTEIKSPYRAWFEGDVEIKRWQKGDAPVQLIHKYDGFPVLTGVHGCFLGPEEVKIYLSDDGYWYLTGKTAHDTRARATIYRYKLPGKLRTIVTEYKLKSKQPINTVKFEDAICSISHITGNFQGLGESLHCEVKPDGKWLFSCDTFQPSVTGTVTCIAFDFPAMLELAQSDEPAPRPMPPGKQPLPDEATIAAARTTLATELTASSDELISLAAQKPAVERYVLLLTARDQAAAAGHCVAAMKATDAIAAGFEVDGLTLANETLQQLRAGCVTPAANRELGQLAIAHFDRVLAVDTKHASLRSLAELALAAARAAEDSDLQRRATLKLLELRK